MNQSEFKFLTDKHIEDGVCEGDEEQFEIAYQLKRIADSLESRSRGVWK